MDGVNQSSQPQATPPPESSGNQQKISERQADDFAKKAAKKKDDKYDAKTSNMEEQSLESLLASRRKKGADTDRPKQEHGDQGGKGDEQPFQGLRDAQGLSPMTDIKNINKITAPKEVNEVINKLVDKIHVSAKDAINGSEIRITMKDNILPGTEIRIQRAGGELTITMNTTSADTQNFLAVNEASLVKSLNERFGDKVQVNINLSGGDQPGDGRSREQYEGDQNQDDDNDS